MTTLLLGGTSRPHRLLRTLALPIMLAASILATPGAASAATGVTTLCSSNSYSCLAGTGYTGQSVWGSWGPGHNCVSYAAYRLSQTGPKPWSGNIGNGSDWDEKARNAGIPVDNTPAAGSIAQWDGGAGHVAYVEVVTVGYIEVSEDNYLTDTSGYSSRRRLDRTGTTFQSAEFIHVRDTAAPGTGFANDVAWQQGSTVYTFAGSGLPTVGQVSGIGTATWAAVGDYNKDGKDDMYQYFAGSDQSIYVLQSNGTTFSSIGRIRGPGVGAPSWAATGDFDGDGFANDVAWQQGSTIYTFAGSELPTVGQVSGIGTATWAAVGDYNKDGKDDIYQYFAGSDQSIYVLQSNGTTFSSIGRIRGPGVGAPSWAATGDFDGDGFANDVAWQQGSTIYTFAGSGLPTVGQVSGIGTATWAAVGDYNKDGKDDIYQYFAGSDQSIYVLQSNGTTFSSIGRIRGPGVGAPNWAATGDFDGV